MGAWIQGGLPQLIKQLKQLETELEKLIPGVVPTLYEPDAATKLIDLLPKGLKSPPVEESDYRAWDCAGTHLLWRDRAYDALAVCWEMYQHMLKTQKEVGQRIHKGLPLCRLADCFERLDFPVHAKRYLMLTLCEDAVRWKGNIPLDKTGSYHRLMWQHGLPDAEFKRYSNKFFELSKEFEIPEDAYFPEALLQNVEDTSWMTEFASAREAASYRVNPYYVRHLLKQLGDGTGRALEKLAEYVMSCMPGCRTMRRKFTYSTDYDLVCAMEGVDVDFRSEFGRYFVCECKDWTTPANMTAMAKFCRILDSTKSRFGILFSRNGISGSGESENAEREQLKVFQDRGIVIIVLDLPDLESIAMGVNLVALLRKRYEIVRLDLRIKED